MSLLNISQPNKMILAVKKAYNECSIVKKKNSYLYHETPAHNAFMHSLHERVLLVRVRVCTHIREQQKPYPLCRYFKIM